MLLSYNNDYEIRSFSIDIRFIVNYKLCYNILLRTDKSVLIFIMYIYVIFRNVFKYRHDEKRKYKGNLKNNNVCSLKENHGKKGGGGEVLFYQRLNIK